MFVLRDLDSLNGTFVNNVRVHGNGTVLEQGDVIRFGYDKATHRLECEEEPPFVEYSARGNSLPCSKSSNSKERLEKSTIGAKAGAGHRGHGKLSNARRGRGKASKKQKEIKQPTAWEICFESTKEPEIIHLAGGNEKNTNDTIENETSDEGKSGHSSTEEFISENKFGRPKEHESRTAIWTAFKKTKGALEKEPESALSFVSTESQSDFTCDGINFSDESPFVYTDDSEYDSAQEHPSFFGFNRVEETRESRTSFYKEYIEKNRLLLKEVEDKPSKKSPSCPSSFAAIPLFPPINSIHPQTQTNSFGALPELKYLSSSIQRSIHRHTSVAEDNFTCPLGSNERKPSYDSTEEYGNEEFEEDGTEIHQLSPVYHFNGSNENHNLISSAHSSLSESQTASLNLVSSSSVEQNDFSNIDSSRTSTRASLSSSKSQESAPSSASNNPSTAPSRQNSLSSECCESSFKHVESSISTDITAKSSSSSYQANPFLNELSDSTFEEICAGSSTSSTNSVSNRQRPHSASSLKSKGVTLSSSSSFSSFKQESTFLSSSVDCANMIDQSFPSDNSNLATCLNMSMNVISSGTSSQLKRPQSAPHRRQWKKSGSFEAMMISSILELSVSILYNISAYLNNGREFLLTIFLFCFHSHQIKVKEKCRDMLERNGIEGVVEEKQGSDHESEESAMELKSSQTVSDNSILSYNTSLDTDGIKDPFSRN